MNSSQVIDDYLRKSSKSISWRHKCRSTLLTFKAQVIDRMNAKQTNFKALLRRWLKYQSQLDVNVHSNCTAASTYEWLNWLVLNKYLSSNPLDQYKDYYSKGFAALLRALSPPALDTALNSLRDNRFKSFLGPTMIACVKRKRSIGRRFGTEEFALRQFDQFLQQQPALKRLSLQESVAAYAKSKPGLYHRLRAMRCGVMLSEELHRHDQRVQVLRVEPGLSTKVARTARKPQILTADDLEQLLKASLSLGGQPLGPLNQYLRLMVILGYNVGLRLGEILRLRVCDLDLANSTIYIHESKFFKSRLLPIRAGTLREIRQVLKIRASSGAPDTPHSKLFWNARCNRPYSRSRCHERLIAVFRKAGLKPGPGRSGARFHDLRHTFAVRRLMQWHREKVDVQSQLPFLATYMGHRDIASTYYYLTLTGELGTLAINKLEAFLKLAKKERYRA